MPGLNIFGSVNFLLFWKLTKVAEKVRLEVGGPMLVQFCFYVCLLSLFSQRNKSEGVGWLSIDSHDVACAPLFYVLGIVV